jgi:predicted ATP-dependent serine protease
MHMQNFQMYLCDVCGYSREKDGNCPRCDLPLTAYSKDDQADYQVDMEEAMRVMSEYKWYV